MKQTQKGFTLIELLAVIVILAVIALIATPIVMNTIKNARLGAAQDSGYAALKAVKEAYLEWQVLNNESSAQAVTYTFGTGAKFTKTGDGTALTGAGATVELNGTQPTEGTVTIDANGNVAIGTALKINGYTCTGNSSKITCS